MAFDPKKFKQFGIPGANIQPQQPQQQAQQQPPPAQMTGAPPAPAQQGAGGEQRYTGMQLPGAPTPPRPGTLGAVQQQFGGPGIGAPGLTAGQMTPGGVNLAGSEAAQARQAQLTETPGEEEPDIYQQWETSLDESLRRNLESIEGARANAERRAANVNARMGSAVGGSLAGMNLQALAGQQQAISDAYAGREKEGRMMLMQQAQEKAAEKAELRRLEESTAPGVSGDLEGKGLEGTDITQTDRVKMLKETGMDSFVNKQGLTGNTEATDFVLDYQLKHGSPPTSSKIGKHLYGISSGDMKNKVKSMNPLNIQGEAEKIAGNEDMVAAIKYYARNGSGTVKKMCKALAKYL